MSPHRPGEPSPPPVDPRTSPRPVVVETTGSTNDDLLAAAAREPQAWPHLSSLRATSQQAGRGRSGRSWVTPPGGALTASVVLRPDVPPHRLPSLTLVGGLACVRALADVGASAGLKWPNDLVVAPQWGDVPEWGELRKVGGLLAQALPQDSQVGAGAGGPAGRPRHPGVVLGVGVNLTQKHADLPVPWAASLAGACDVHVGADELWERVLTHLAALAGQWEAGGGSLAPLHAHLERVTTTLGRRVRVEGAVREDVVGTAVGLDEDGRLLIDTSKVGTDTSEVGAYTSTAGPRLVAVDAGDVMHLRLPGTPARHPPA